MFRILGFYLAFLLVLLAVEQRIHDASGEDSSHSEWNANRAPPSSGKLFLIFVLIGPTMIGGSSSVALTYWKGLGTENGGASGILVSEDWIISHGSLLNAKVVRDPRIRKYFESIKSGGLKSVPLNMRDDLKLRVYQNGEQNIDDNGIKISAGEATLNPVSFPKVTNSEIEEYEGLLLAAWKCPLLEKTFAKLFNDWSFEKTRKSNEFLLSIFLIVRIKNQNLKVSQTDLEASQILRVLNNFYENCDPSLRYPARSSSLEISSTPFGNPVFIDSISRGVVSNVFGDDGCIMLTDANAVPGSEGAPVYVTRSDGTRSNICGMVIAPLSWCRGEWVDYTFAASLLPCLGNLLRPRIVNQQLADQSETRIADSLDRSLVLVRCGDGWGTGIIYDAGTGTVITCSHVVHKAPESRIKVVLRRGNAPQSSGSSSSSAWAKLVYRTAKGEPYDVAILRLDPSEIEPTLSSIKIADDGPVLRGEVVGSAGFPFFSSRFPTVTRGNVSGLTECMLRTTCRVQSGSSGGPIFRWSNGKMLGMVVCNAIDTNRTKLYPGFNMAVPVSVLEPPISEYLKTGEVKALDVLGSNDYNVRRTWNFHRLPSSKL